MRLRLLILASTFLFGGLLMVAGQDSGGGVALTVYNEGSALIRDQRTLSLDEGINIVKIGDVAATIDPSSVSVRAAGAAKLQVIEQSYKGNLANRDALFAQFAGETITVTAIDGVVYTGELLFGRGDDLILREEDGGIVMPNINDARDIRFPRFPRALVTEPTLQWRLRSDAAGEQPIELTYLADGMNWSADYTLLLNADESAFDLQGWVTLHNRTGAAFHEARLKLVAGDLSRVAPEAEYAEERMMAMSVAADAGAIQQRDLSEYKLYAINRPVTIEDRETKQIEFVSGANIAAKTAFVFDSSPQFSGYYSPVDYPEGYGSGGGSVMTILEFNTGAESGLGADLPAGRVRVYQTDLDGAGLLIGENRIDHTPEGETLRIPLGIAFDLTGERVQTDYSIVSQRVARESFEIRLRNRKDDEAVSVIVPERLYRWRAWQIIESSAPFVQKDSASIEFVIELAPGAEETLSYTVEYNFPADY